MRRRCRATMPEFMNVPGTRVVAVCDVHSNRMAAVRQIAGGEKVRAYHDFRRLLADKDVDAVVISTNAHWHVLCTIYACQAGKDVYVEKPLGNFIGEGRFAVEAARTTNGSYRSVRSSIAAPTTRRPWRSFSRAGSATSAK